MRIRVHPLFIVLAAVLVVTGHALVGLWTFLAVTLHETGHALAARARGYVVSSLTIFPFGAMMSVEENFDRASAVIVGLAGPLTNAFLALITLGIWWLFPSVYDVTRLFLYANVSLCVFNLLPVYPLDGSRVVLGLCKNRIRAVKGLRAAGVAVSVIMMALFIASAFYDINFTLGIVAVFLFYGAVFQVTEECYVSVFAPSAKDYGGGVELRTVEISAETSIARLFRFVSPSYSTTFILVDGKGKEKRRLNETAMQKIAVGNKLSTPIGNAAETANNNQD